MADPTKAILKTPHSFGSNVVLSLVPSIEEDYCLSLSANSIYCYLSCTKVDLCNRKGLMAKSSTEVQVLDLELFSISGVFNSWTAAR